MDVTINKFEYDYLESKTKLALTKDEYRLIKECLIAEQTLKEFGLDVNSMDINKRIIAIICASFGFYIDQSGELTYSN